MYIHATLTSLFFFFRGQQTQRRYLNWTKNQNCYWDGRAIGLRHGQGARADEYWWY